MCRAPAATCNGNHLGRHPCCRDDGDAVRLWDSTRRRVSRLPGDRLTTSRARRRECKWLLVAGDWCGPSATRRRHTRLWPRVRFARWRLGGASDRVGNRDWRSRVSARISRCAHLRRINRPSADAGKSDRHRRGHRHHAADRHALCPYTSVRKLTARCDVTELQPRCDCKRIISSFTGNIANVGGFDLVSLCSRTGVMLHGVVRLRGGETR